VIRFTHEDSAQRAQFFSEANHSARRANPSAKLIISAKLKSSAKLDKLKIYKHENFRANCGA
jgi:hypothetical protein